MEEEGTVEVSGISGIWAQFPSLHVHCMLAVNDELDT